jgi:5-(carboxyamino)imidazole ribonucleotide synthase
MLALAGIPLGLRFRFLEPSANPPVRDLGVVVRAPYDDLAALDRFGKGLDVVTYEFEIVPAETAKRIGSFAPVFPPPAALEMTQDRLVEKEAFQRLGIPTPPFAAVDAFEDLVSAVRALGFPAVLKTRRLGYDGKGQRMLRTERDLDGAWEDLEGVPLLAESFVAFERELSILGVRGRDGETVFYPLVENVHRDGILHTSRAPVESLDAERQSEAEGIALKIMNDLEYVGVIAVELFETRRGLLANEFAPRVHNSGHWTQDGAVTSQFENHLRAILGLPLGSPEPRGWSGMVNLLGVIPERAPILALPGAHLHLYDKPPRPDRKLGHVNVIAASPRKREEKLALVEALARG